MNPLSVAGHVSKQHGSLIKGTGLSTTGVREWVKDLKLPKSFPDEMKTELKVRIPGLPLLAGFFCATCGAIKEKEGSRRCHDELEPCIYQFLGVGGPRLRVVERTNEGLEGEDAEDVKFKRLMEDTVNKLPPYTNLLLKFRASRNLPPHV